MTYKIHNDMKQSNYDKLDELSCQKIYLHLKPTNDTNVRQVTMRQ